LNYVGLLLILVGIGLFVTEIFTSAYALFALAGLVSLILGLLLTFQASVNSGVFYGLFVLMLALVAGGAFFIVRRVSESRLTHVAAGKEDLIGRLAQVRSHLHPTGTVFIEGELWNARIVSGEAEPGEQVVIVGVEGLVLTVRKK